MRNEIERACLVDFPLDQLEGLVADTDCAWDSTATYLVGKEDIRAKDIVADDLGANEPAHNLSSMDAYTYTKSAQTILLILGVLFVEYLLHLDTNLQTIESLIDLDRDCTLIKRRLSCVAHCNIASTDGVDLVDASLLAEMIELAENPREHLNVILRFDISREI